MGRGGGGGGGYSSSPLVQVQIFYDFHRCENHLTFMLYLFDTGANSFLIYMESFLIHKLNVNFICSKIITPRLHLTFFFVFSE